MSWEFDRASFWMGFFTSPLLAVVIVVVVALSAMALAKNRGVGGCRVCDHGFACEPGEYTRIGIWLRSRRHNWFIRTRRWHRDAWANNRWNPYRSHGVGDDGATAALRRPQPHWLRRAWYFIRY